MDGRRGEYFGDVPRELDVEYAMYLDYDDIINLCQTQRSFRKVCENDEFWREKTEYELSKYEVDEDDAHLPQEEFLKHAIEDEQYHYIKHLFEMFDFSDEELGYAMRALRIKGKRIFELLWDRLEDRLIVKLKLLPFAVKHREIAKIEKLVTSYDRDFSNSRFHELIYLSEKDFMNVLQLISQTGYKFKIDEYSISKMMDNSAERNNILIYFEYYPKKLRGYIKRKIKSYNSHREQLHGKSKNEELKHRKKMFHILHMLKIILDTFLTPEWKDIIKLPYEIIDKLRGMFDLPYEDVAILLSWIE